MSDTDLDDLLAGVRDGAGENSPPAEQLSTALRRYREPPVIQVAGRAGVGKSAVTVALGLPLTAELPAAEPDSPIPDGDLVVWVLPGSWDSIDKRALGALAPGRRLAILNTADTGPSVAAGLAVASKASEDIAAQTVPLFCWLAAQVQHTGLNEEELRAFRALAAAGNPLLTMSPDLFIAAPGPLSASVRTELLGHWDFAGVCAIISALQADSALSSRALNQILYSASGLAQLRGVIKQRLAQVDALRGGDLLMELAAIAARADGQARDQIESFQRGPAAAELSLAAGLAHPELAAHTSAEHQETGAELLQYWSRVAGDGKLSAAARRAALHIHHGYGCQSGAEAHAHA